MARLNEAQLAFLFGFCCGSEWSWLEFRQRMEETLERTRVETRRHCDETLAQIKEEQRRFVEEEIERFYKEQQRKVDERFERLEEESDARLRALFDAFVAAIKQTVRDPDTVLKIWNAVEAELARPRAAGSATTPHHRPGDT